MHVDEVRVRVYVQQINCIYGEILKVKPIRSEHLVFVVFRTYL